MMLGLFPTPYPDELLYSVCARYASLFNYPTNYLPIYKFFGPTVKLLPIELPRNLSHLISVIPGKHSFTIDRIINDHTMLPYYSRFMPQDRFNKIVKNMTARNSTKVFKLTNTKLIKNTYYLRFCPVCAKEDLKKYGEYYWHRKHQLQGIAVCFQHKVFLEKTSVKYKNRRKSYELINANDAIKITRVRSLDTTILYHRVLLQLSKDAAWLLETPISNNEYELLHNRYLQLFIKKGLAQLTGVMRVTELVKQVKRYFSQGILKKLHCYIQKNETNWLTKFLPSINIKRGIHPVHHLLMLQFLGIKPSKFFLLKPIQINTKPFGNGPWPCLDPTSNHFRKLTISKYDKMVISNNGSKRRAIFRCYCGFAYSRVGPEQSPKDKYKYHLITSFSASWVNKLKKLWSDKSLSMEAIAKKLGMDVNTFKRCTKLLKLHPDRQKIKRIRNLAKTKQFRSQVTFNNTLRKYRKEFIEFLKRSPDINRKALYTANSRLTFWLRRYDREWYEKTCQLLLKDNNINWQKRDIVLSKEIKNAAKQILNKKTKPVKVTLNAICKLISFNRQLLLSERRKNLPLSLIALKKVLETHEDFVIRKMKWVVASYKKSGKLMSRHKFQRSICTDPTLLKYKGVRKAIDSTLKMLKFSNN